MADTATIQNSADVGNQKPVSGGGGKPKIEKIVIGKPFTVGGRADNVIKFIQVDGGPRLTSGWKVRDGSKVEVFGRGLDRYNQIALWMGGQRELISGGDVHRKPGGEGLEFTARFGTNLYADGLLLEVEFLESNRPDNDRTLERRFRYVKESKEEEKKRKAREAGEGGGGSSGGGASASPGPTAMVLGAMGDVFGGIAGALKSTSGTSSAGIKTLSESGTAIKPGANQISAEVSDGGGGDGGEIEQEFVEETGGGQVTSTSEISTGGQTVSQSGTVSAGGQVISGGRTSVEQAVSSGGTVESSGSTQVSGEVSSGGTVQSTGSASVSGGASSSAVGMATGGGSLQSSVTQGAVAGGGASGTADISRRVVSMGGTSGGGTVTGQSTVTGTQGAGGGARTTADVTAELKENINVTGEAEVKAEAEDKVNARDNLSSEAQPSPTPSAPASSPAAGGGTTGAGLASPSFGGGTMPSQPAGLGRMKQNDAARNLNISSGGTAMPKPAQGGAGAPGSAAGKGKPVDGVANQPPAKDDQKNQNNLPAGSDAGKSSDDKEPGAKTKPGDEGKDAKPLSEAPLGKTEPPGGPKNDDTQVAAPMGEGALNRHPDNQQSPDNNQDGGDNRTPGKGGPPSSTPGEGGGGPVAVPSQAGEPQTPGGSPGSPAGPSSAQNRNPRNILDDPRKPKEENPFAEKNNPAAYPTVRRLIDKNSELAEKGLKVGGKTTSKIWYYGFGSSCATFFTGLDFMLGAVVMDAYWIFGHRKNPELFPLKGWQKIVTIVANIIPPILIVLILAFIMVAGCNLSAIGLSSTLNQATSYRTSVIGAFIGDDCKYFDVSNITSSSSSTSGVPAAPTQTGSQTSSGPITPR